MRTEVENTSANRSAGRKLVQPVGPCKGFQRVRSLKALVVDSGFEFLLPSEVVLTMECPPFRAQIWKFVSTLSVVGGWHLRVSVWLTMVSKWAGSIRL
jgi:hypothetical protein